MVTLGVEAADDPYFITRLVQQGADVVESIVLTTMKTSGPTCRTCTNSRAKTGTPNLHFDGYRRPEGPHLGCEDLAIALAYSSATSSFAAGACIGILWVQHGLHHPEIFGRLKVGDRVSLDDGKLRGRIIRQSEEGLVAALRGAPRRV